MKKEVIVHKNPKSPYSEIFRTLRTNIQFMDLNKKMKVLNITSTFPGEGKSWVASNLSVTFAQAGKKVVLIDSDMRKGRQYAIFGVSPKPGLSNFLSQAGLDENGKLTEDIANYIQSTEVENLYMLPAGTVPPNPSELLISSQMIRLLDELKEIFDMIIIDGTPSELVTDSVILSRLADSTVIVTAHKVTKKDALERVVRNIKNVDGKIAGVVINKMPISSKKYGERYYYYGELPNKSGKNKNKRNAPKESKIGNFKSKPFFEKNTEKKNFTEETNTITNINNTEYKKQEKPQEPSYSKQESITDDKLEEANNILKQINEYLEQNKIE